MRTAVHVMLGLVAASTVALAGCRRAPPPGPWDPAGGSPRPREVLLPVEGRPQARSLSCESRSACDLLGFLGRPLAEAVFLAGLPVADNPEEGFVGDVDGPGEQLPPADYGVHAPPVAARLRALGVTARAVRGVDLDWLRDEIAAHRPVIVWAPATLQALRPVRLEDRRGRAFTAVRGEHTFLAVGYAPGVVVLLDPAHGRTRRVFAERFDRAWAVLGRMAVAVEPSPETRAARPPAVPFPASSR